MCKLGVHTSNNQAKYDILIIRLVILATMKAQYHKIRWDSQLVIKQVTGEYKCYNAKLKKLRASAHNLLKLFDDIVVMYIPRDGNQDANDPAQQASSYKEMTVKVVK